MKFLLTFICLFLLLSLVSAFWTGVTLIFLTNSILLWIVIGLTIGAIVYFKFIIELHGLLTFEHELTHAIMALFFFRKLNKFATTSYSGGFGGNIGDIFIGLAPYYLPTFTILSVFIRPFLPNTWFPWYDIWIGFTFAYHTFSNIAEIRENWNKKRFKSAGSGEMVLSDIGRRGYIFSAIIISTFTFFTHSIMFWVLCRGYSSFSQ